MLGGSCRLWEISSGRSLCSRHIPVDPLLMAESYVLEPWQLLTLAFKLLTASSPLTLASPALLLVPHGPDHLCKPDWLPYTPSYGVGFTLCPLQEEPALPPRDLTTSQGEGRPVSSVLRKENQQNMTHSSWERRLGERHTLGARGGLLFCEERHTSSYEAAALTWGRREDRPQDG